MASNPAASRCPRGLFLNPVKANCSIHESGRMIYDCLKLGPRFQLDYQEVSAESNQVAPDYDFYLFNYHHATMAWLNTKSVRSAPGLKMTLVLETMPNDPFVLCPRGDFDVYLALDPTMQSDDSTVYAFPRPLELAPPLPEFNEGATPTIGTFGFATPGKGFELVVEAVNREFDEAIVRINIPPSSYADGVTWKIHRQPYSEYLAELCRKVAKPGIRVEVTNDYMDKDSLIRWCASNTLNCFLYNRMQPGLSATTDQAISSGRPLAVSANYTFRHIHPYLVPYPRRSLKESIAHSIPDVARMREDWHPARFLEQFEKVLADMGLLSAGLVTEVVTKTKPRLLLVNHSAKQCGIHQYGRNLARVLEKSDTYDVRYAECDSESALKAAVASHRPAGIIYNHYPHTMPWLKPGVTRSMPGVRIGILHETTQEVADAATDELFQAILCPDPTMVERNPITHRLLRIIPPYINTQPLQQIPLIGSFGFGFADKGFERLVEQVQEEFDQAVILLHMPFNDTVDPGGAKHAMMTAERCRALVRKPGVRLAIHHAFLPLEGLLQVLGSCHLNAFFYDTEKQAGISSVIEHALAVQRPIAISRSGMFRHVSCAAPSICIEDRSLREIMEQGIAPLIPFYSAWSEDAFLLDAESVLDRIFEKAGGVPQTPGTIEPPLPGYVTQSVVQPCRILTRRDSEKYSLAIQRLAELAPSAMKQGATATHLQQGFVFDTLLKLAAVRNAPNMLCVAAHDDASAAALKSLGYTVVGIDPFLNLDLEAFHRSQPTLHGKLDFVFSTSALAHVSDDGAFLSQTSDFRATGGLAVLTCDFLPNPEPGRKLPAENCRFYKKRDLLERLLPRMKGCVLVGEPDWSGPELAFEREGLRYAVATMVIQKVGN